MEFSGYGNVGPMVSDFQRQSVPDQMNQPHFMQQQGPHGHGAHYGSQTSHPGPLFGFPPQPSQMQPNAQGMAMSSSDTHHSGGSYASDFHSPQRNAGFHGPGPSLSPKPEHTKASVQPSFVPLSKPPKGPDKPLIPYLRFSKSVWDRVKIDNPGLPFAEIGKVIGQQWRQCTDEEKAKYTADYLKDKEKYAQAQKAFLESPEYLEWLRNKNHHQQLEEEAEKAAKARAEQQQPSKHAAGSAVSTSRANPMTQGSSTAVQPGGFAQLLQGPLEELQSMSQRMLSTKVSGGVQPFQTPLQPAEPDDDADDFLRAKHIASVRYRRNHKLMAETFSDAVVPDGKMVVTEHRITVLRRQVQSLAHHQDRLMADKRDMIEKHAVKRQKMMEDGEAFDKKLAAVKEECKPLSKEQYQALVDKYYKMFEKHVADYQSQQTVNRNQQEDLLKPVEEPSHMTHDTFTMDTTPLHQEPAQLTHGTVPMDITPVQQEPLQMAQATFVMDSITEQEQHREEPPVADMMDTLPAQESQAHDIPDGLTRVLQTRPESQNGHEQFPTDGVPAFPPSPPATLHSPAATTSTSPPSQTTLQTEPEQTSNSDEIPDSYNSSEIFHGVATEPASDNAASAKPAAPVEKSEAAPDLPETHTQIQTLPDADNDVDMAPAEGMDDQPGKLLEQLDGKSSPPESDVVMADPAHTAVEDSFPTIESSSAVPADPLSLGTELSTDDIQAPEISPDLQKINDSPKVDVETSGAVTGDLPEAANSPKVESEKSSEEPDSIGSANGETAAEDKPNELDQGGQDSTPVPVVIPSQSVPNSEPPTSAVIPPPDEAASVDTASEAENGAVSDAVPTISDTTLAADTTSAEPEKVDRTEPDDCGGQGYADYAL